ncbi:PREDICTED: VHS domain-containing protein At3g16270 [Ipomoea nil]|uniref:VHS domain-containing protein At3g16270 n=1 Tax=Ipomoea nil TaxID=35883 RepID=UPI000901365D|nr:PREDICTED: VHS domain-containing protein At3g16270 [Ipomoea nil]
MEQSRRAVESYWRSRMVDGATSDEDKVTPVYKLEEICELLRSSHAGIVKEVSEFILKRLQHKSPIVKQKALRVIKYAIGKSGAEFRREMQRNSVSIRQLIHYKGQPDPLKGDALNKAVRETAQEALSALFSSSDDIKPAPKENLGGRIQGFGNTNFEMPSEDKKSFISEVVGIGSATIKHGLSSLTQSPSLKKNDTGSYRGPNLQRSLTRETDYSDRYEGITSYNESQNSSGFSRNAGSQSWGQDLKTSDTETTNRDLGMSSGEKTREERLLETIATSGGVRLQPTRDALQAFLAEASKLDALAIIHAIESKLHSPSWQVRVKTICVLEAILRKKDDEHFCIIASYFSENNDVVVKCSESPQASLREKANKVLSLLDLGQGTSQTVESVAHSDKLANTETVQMPDLIDTGDSDDLFDTDGSVQMQNNENVANTSSPTAPLIDDLFGIGTDLNTSEQKNDDDPFADVSFHSSNDKEHESDLFSGMTFDKPGSAEVRPVPSGNGPEPFDIFGSSSDITKEESVPQKDVHDLMSGLSLNQYESSTRPNGSSGGTTLENILPNSNPNPGHNVSNDVFNSMPPSQISGSSTIPMFPLGAMAYNMPPGFMLNPSFASQALNTGAMGNLFAQQQFLAAMSTFQQMGSLQQTASVNPASGSNGGYNSALPDIFNANIPNQTPTSLMNSQKKEDTRAFDFISDHLAAARDPKRVI